MRNTTRVKVAVALGAAALFVACATGSSSMTGPIVAPATDLPDHFMVTETGLSKLEDPKPGQGCRNPMSDPRKGTILNLMRSANGTGDYQVLGEDFQYQTRYGVDSMHYLRVDCATGKALGIVKP